LQAHLKLFLLFLKTGPFDLLRVIRKDIEYVAEEMKILAFCTENAHLYYYTTLACVLLCKTRLRITGEVCVYENYTYWGLRLYIWVGFGARTKISWFRL
jgi:hypothetical protein